MSHFFIIASYTYIKKNSNLAQVEKCQDKVFNSIVVEARSCHACITWFFVYEVQNIQLNKGLPYTKVWWTEYFFLIKIIQLW